MGHQFAQHNEAEVPASPDEVWAAIATGPGINSWFMGRNEVKAGAGGTVRTVFGEYTPELDITDWDPGHRFAYGSGQAPDGRFIAYEFLIEGRAGASTVLRSKTPDLVQQELWGLLLAHFAVRQLMAQAAWRRELDPDRLSFMHAVRVIKRKLPQAAAVPP